MTADPPDPATTALIELFPEQWTHFVARLNDPPKPNDALRRLMTTKPPWVER